MAVRILWRILEWPVALAWWLYGTLVRVTSRIRVEGRPPEGAAIFVNWHRYQPFLIVHHGRHRRWMLVSPAPPLIPIARFCRLCGLRLVRGTSGDRGKQALEEMAGVIARGDSVTIAVDGPAGPRLQAKRGCADLSLRTGAPIVPVWYECRRGGTLQWRWDHTLMPVPFDRIVIRYGQPIAPRGTAEELLETVSGALA
jgi:lysophospholipid acyltransferase (LPLAT)-like uncharacterized protein